MYGLYGTDGMMHLVEEMRDASKEAPRVMVWSMIFCSVTSWLAALLMMWTAGDWESYMSASQLYMNWFMDVTGSVIGGGVFCTLLMMGLNFFIIVGTNNAGSRLAWSKARDQGLPYSKYFSEVSDRYGVPLRTMVAILVIDLIIGKCGLCRAISRPENIAGGETLTAKHRPDYPGQRFSFPKYHLRGWSNPHDWLCHASDCCKHA
jgi:choline transport protein